jgi:hypothetical protein
VPSAALGQEDGDEAPAVPGTGAPAEPGTDKVEGDPCEEVDCSGHGSCVVENESPSCVCDEGFEPHLGGTICLSSDIDQPSDLRYSEESRVSVVSSNGDRLTQKRYAAGGVIGTIFSAGIGHMVVGEWTSIGWVFTLGEAVGVGILITGLYFTDDGSPNHDMALGRGLVFGGLGVMLATWIWEKIDIWSRPYPRLERGSEADADFIRAGVAGTIVGFGIGHYMAREPVRGTILLVVEGAATAAMVGGAVAAEDLEHVLLLIGGTVTLLVSRIWEKVDIWSRSRLSSREAIGPTGRTVVLVPEVAPVLGQDGLGGGVVGLGGTF